MISWHRFYDPETGRYISADPIGLAGGINLYAYTGGDPVNLTDPTGEYVQVIPVLIIGFGVAIAMQNSDVNVPDIDWPKEQEQCEEKKTCSEKYPDLVKCERLYRYHLWSKTKGTQVVKNYLQNERGRSGGISVKKDGEAHSGPCAGRGGEHYKIQQRGAFIGTCNMCPCCEDTPSGAEKWYAWDVNAY